MIRVGSLKWAQALEPDPETVVISIVGPGRTASLKEGWKDVLSLEFYDLDPVKFDFDLDDLEMHGAFGPKHAQEILTFLSKHKGSPLVIHCEAGISRSVAVGRFAATLMNVPVEYVEGFGDQHYNAHVHATLVRALMAPEET